MRWPPRFGGGAFLIDFHALILFESASEICDNYDMWLPGFGETVLSGSRFVFWALSPVLAMFALILTALMPSWPMFLIDAVVLLAILTLWNPRRFKWAGRIVAGAIGAALAFLSASVIKWNAGRIRADRDNLEALFAFVMALPFLRYAVTGRLGGLLSRHSPERHPNEPIEPA